MRYKNVNCPVCDEIFEHDNDVVTCPICGTPHHKNCYAEISHCINQDKHAQGFEWVSPLKVNNDTNGEVTPANTPLPTQNPYTDFTALPNPYKTLENDGAENTFSCPSCGFENANGALFCQKCGEKLNAAPFRALPFAGGKIPAFAIDEAEEIGGQPVIDFARHIRVGVSSYIPKFFKMEKLKKKFSWNWASFAFTPYWFFYRKMFLPGLLFLLSTLSAFFVILPFYSAFSNDVAEFSKSIGINTANSYTDLLLSNTEVLSHANSLLTGKYKMIIFYVLFLGLVHVLGGLLGNMLYKRKVTNDIKKSKIQADDHNGYLTLLRRRGGTSSLLFVCSFFLYQIGTSFAITYLPKILELIGWTG